MPEPKDFLLDLFTAAVRAASPWEKLATYLPEPPKGRTVVVGAGKAAAAMAAALEQNWPGKLEGLVITRYAHAVPCRDIKVVEAGHPVPDDAAFLATQQILESVDELGADDLVIALISGGGSALMTCPTPSITLEHKRAVTRALLKSGATISEMNCVRKHLSSVKGGRLATRAYPARTVTLAVSDVPGDDPAVIASGPTVADPTTCDDALEILDRYGINPGEDVIRCLQSGDTETPKSGAPELSRATTKVIVTPQEALEAAANVAEAAGVNAYILSDRMEGEARDIALAHAAIASQVAERSQPFPVPAVILSGGETTVTVRGEGRGGRNAEFLLALANALDGRPGIFALACDTDGIDGTEDNAGACIDPTTISRALSKGMFARAFLQENDGYSFFDSLGDLIKTGPTLTNVNDFRAILVDPKDALTAGVGPR
ncbi:glycerate kinase [Thalassospiraceae bacterium LMO-JJ14]|nr:glycerate kinase [Thalassospiraceae bacterium LMO-JJ14]